MVRQAQPVKWSQRFLANLKRSNPGAGADERELREFARAITNHLLLITSVNFLILPLLLLPFTAPRPKMPRAWIYQAIQSGIRIMLDARNPFVSQ